MSRESLKTLFHPFVTEAVALPAADSRWLFLGAEAGFAKPEGFAAEPDALLAATIAAESARWKQVIEAADEGFDKVYTSLST